MLQWDWELIQMQTRKTNDKVLFLTQSALLAAVLCVLCPLSIPIGPVPITMGFFAVMLAGVMLNWKRALMAVLAYILLGAIGLPVFSGGKGGFAVLAGATGGYIWGYLPMVAIIGLLGGRPREGVLAESAGALLSCVAAMAVCYALGALQFAWVMEKDWRYALSVCVYPFVAVDLVKAACASLLGVQIRRRLKRAGLM